MHIYTHIYSIYCTYIHWNVYNCIYCVYVYINIEKLLSHKKEWIWVSSIEMDEPRAYYTEWSKSETEKQISYTNSNTLATSCEELTHWKRLWCWEGLGAGGERNDRGWDGWMASPTRSTWVWVNSGSWWWTGRPGVLWSWGHKESDMTERLNWTEHKYMESRKVVLANLFAWQQ